MSGGNNISRRDIPREEWDEFYIGGRFGLGGPTRENYGHLVMERNTGSKTGKNKVYVFLDNEVVMEIGILESEGKKVKQSYSALKDYRIVREEVLNRRERKAVLEWKVQNGNH